MTMRRVYVDPACLLMCITRKVHQSTVTEQLCMYNWIADPSWCGQNNNRQVAHGRGSFDKNVQVRSQFLYLLFPLWISDFKHWSKVTKVEMSEVSNRKYVIRGIWHTRPVTTDREWCYTKLKPWTSANQNSLVLAHNGVGLQCCLRSGLGINPNP